MVFSSSAFLFAFLPAVILTYYLINPRYRNLVLLAFSLVFYAWGEPKNILLMLLSIGVNYGLGFAVTGKHKRFFLWIAVVFNIGMLFIFKYLTFVMDTVYQIRGMVNTQYRIALPIGISFYTFQILSYVIDVYREETKPQRNLLDLGLYVSLFPQLIAGPIVRYVDVEEQIQDREVNWEKVRRGLVRFATGFFKKIVIADQLSSLVEAGFTSGTTGWMVHWAVIIAYTLQIYFDFSGYSDMAIGLGKIFGFDFPENFDHPYVSTSIQEFWRRWHISLSTWFRDYLYIPLGGNRKGKIRTYINLLIVFMMTGLWHGASFSFLVWGLYYAVFLILERLGFKKTLKRLPRVVRHLYTMIIVMIGWVFFRAETLGDAVVYIGEMFHSSGRDFLNLQLIMNRQYWFTILLGGAMSLPWIKAKAYIRDHASAQLAADILMAGGFFLAICYMVGSGYSPFLYFRF